MSEVCILVESVCITKRRRREIGSDVYKELEVRKSRSRTLSKSRAVPRCSYLMSVDKKSNRRKSLFHGSGVMAEHLIERKRLL